jgi:hypothetical protein
MKKITAIILSAILLLCLAGCDKKQDLVLDEAKTYEITTEIKSLDIRINAADFKIKQGEKFSVESNLAKLEVRENNGTLTLEELTKNNVTNAYNGAMLTICIPEGTVFEHITLLTGAGKLTIDTLSAKRIDFKLGAGEVSIGSLFASEYANIDGGAGNITVSDGALNRFNLNMGVGELNLISALSGDCDLEMGVGAATITLIGNKNDYKLDISKGLGSITVDGQVVTDFGSSGNGTNSIKINGGVGSIDLKFKGAEAQ